MLSALERHLRRFRVILASQSPRRFELLRDCGLTFEVMASTFEETLPKEEFSSPAEYAMETAKEKALEVFRRVARDTASGGVQRPTLVIGCDTIVVHDGVILEKPRDEDDAFDMLTKLSKDPHDVFSGVALFSTTRGMDKPHVFFEHTSLVFGSLEPEDIRAYITTGEPMDKAGAYGLQGRARCFVKEVHGCSNNVIGFPIQRFCHEVQALSSSNEL